MIQVTYRSATGQVVRRFQPPKGWTLGDLKNDVERARAAHGDGLRAYMTVEASNSSKAQERASA